MNYTRIIYRGKADVSRDPPATRNNTHSARQQVFISIQTSRQLFSNSQLRINYRRHQLSGTQNMISQSEVSSIGSSTGISKKLVGAKEEPIKPIPGKVKASMLQNHKLKEALAQYISRLRRSEGKNKREFIRRDPRANEREGSIR